MQTQSRLCKRDDDGGGGISLPEDIILEILVRLPAKALRRFRCVCKVWRALIAAPGFVLAQRSRAKGPFIAAVFGSAPELELRLMDKGSNVLIVFKVWGITALLAPTRLDRIFVDQAELGAWIVDPASGRDSTVVGANDRPPPPKLRAVSSDYSFGRDPMSGDYKVLRLVTTKSSRRHGRSDWCEVATICLDDDVQLTWRQRPWGPFSQNKFCYEQKATVNGDLYFMLFDIDTYSTSRGSNLIATFNLESEEWKPENIEGPLLRCKNKEDKWRITLTELKGTLCMVQNVEYLADLVGHYANIWLLKDPNTGVWVKEYKIQLRERLFLFTKPLDVLIDGTLLLMNTFRKAGNNKNCHRYVLQFYNSRTKAFTYYMEMGEGFSGKLAFYTGGLES